MGPMTSSSRDHKHVVGRGYDLVKHVLELPKALVAPKEELKGR